MSVHKKVTMILIMIISFIITGCAGSGEPMLNANSNKVNVFSLGGLLNIKSIHYDNAMNGNSGTVSNLKD